MPSRIDEAGHTKAFDYPVAEHWGKCSVPRMGLEPTTHRSGVERATNWATPAPPPKKIMSKYVQKGRKSCLVLEMNKKNAEKDKP